MRDELTVTVVGAMGARADLTVTADRRTGVREVLSALRLVDSVTTTTGVVIATYQSAEPKTT